jgi:hypothetical protein
MTFRQLAARIDGLTERQKDCDASIAVEECGDVEFYEITDFVGSWPKNDAERERTFTTDAEGVLDYDHPFMTVIL